MTNSPKQPPIHLITEFTIPTVEQRAAEYLFCLHQNLANVRIASVTAFVNSDSLIRLSDEKLTMVKRERRPTIFDLLTHCNEQKFQNCLCIIANGDIAFDETLALAQFHLKKESVFALSRWDRASWSDEFSLFDNAASQDCWCFIPPVKLRPEMDFHLALLDVTTSWPGYYRVLVTRLVIQQSPFGRGTYIPHNSVPVALTIESRDLTYSCLQSL